MSQQAKACFGINKKSNKMLKLVKIPSANSIVWFASQTTFENALFWGSAQHHRRRLTFRLLLKRVGAISERKWNLCFHLRLANNGCLVALRSLDLDVKASLSLYFSSLYHACLSFIFYLLHVSSFLQILHILFISHLLCFFRVLVKLMHV